MESLRVKSILHAITMTVGIRSQIVKFHASIWIPVDSDVSSRWAIHGGKFGVICAVRFKHRSFSAANKIRWQSAVRTIAIWNGIVERGNKNRNLNGNSKLEQNSWARQSKSQTHEGCEIARSSIGQVYWLAGFQLPPPDLITGSPRSVVRVSATRRPQVSGRLLTANPRANSASWSGAELSGPPPPPRDFFGQGEIGQRTGRGCVGI
jgi:hypothetical protein